MLIDDFFKRIKHACGTRGTDFENNAFFITGINLLGDQLHVWLEDHEGDECAFSFGTNDLVDELEEYITCSHPDDAKRGKDETLAALQLAIDRIKNMPIPKEA